MFAFIKHLSLICLIWQALMASTTFASENFLLDVKAQESKLHILLKEKDTILFDQDLTNETTFQGGTFKRQENGFLLSYNSPTTQAAMDIFICSNGDIELWDSSANTRNDAYWSWRFNTTGTLINHAHLLFYIINTNAHQFHNYGIIKALTGNMVMSYKFNAGVFDFGDARTPICSEAYPLNLCDAEAVPTYQANAVDDYGIMLTQYGHRIIGLTYRVHGLYLNQGDLTLEKACLVNKSSSCMVEGTVYGNTHSIENQKYLSVGQLHDPLVAVTNSGMLHFEKPCDLITETWDNTGSVMSDHNVTFHARSKLKKMGSFAVGGFSSSVTGSIDPEALKGFIHTPSHKMRIKKTTKHYLETTTYHHVRQHNQWGGYHEYLSHTTVDTRHTHDTVEETEVDIPGAPGEDMMAMLLHMQAKARHALADSMKDAIRKNAHKLAGMNANKNDLVCGLIEALTAAGMSLSDIGDILSDPEIDSLLSSVAAWDEADQEERAVLSDAQTDSGSTLTKLIEKAQRTGTNTVRWVSRNPGEFMDAICTMASIGRAIMPAHPVTQSFMGLCGLRQAQLAMSGGRVGPKAQGCLVENQSRMSMYFRDIQNKGQGLPANPNPGKPSERLINVSKPESSIWRELKPYRYAIKTNGQNGSKREYYKWDHTHNDIEVFNHKGDHLGSMHPVTGKIYKPAVPGRIEKGIQ